MTDGITVVDASGSLVYANLKAARLLDFNTVEEFLQANPQELLERFVMWDEHGQLLTAFELPSRQALQGKVTPATIIKFKKKSTEEIQWASILATPIYDDGGHVSLVVTVFKDITFVRQKEEEQQRRRKRQEFLSQASDLLAASLDYETTLKNITSLVVPALADWAAVDMLAADNTVRRLAVAHQDPLKVQWAFELEKQFPVDMQAPTGLPQVLRSGLPEFYPKITEEMLVHAAKDQEELDLIKKIGFTSVIIMPLKVFNNTIGAITLVTAESQVTFTAEDLVLAEELARRAGLAITNARLFKQVQDAAKREHEQALMLDTLLANAPVGFVFLDVHFQYIRVNKALAEINGLTPEAHTGKNIFEIFPEFEDLLRPVLERVLLTGQPEFNVEISGQTRAQPGMLRHWITNYYPVFTAEGIIAGIGGIVSEITLQRAAQQEIQYRANYDILTGLPNRKSFEEKALKCLHTAKARRSKMAILFADMDRLKNINDTLGHDAGDAVLKEIAGRVRACLRKEDMVSRWGGDEFVILLPEIFGAADAGRVADKILGAIQPVMRIGPDMLHITASLGIALFPADGEDVPSLLKNADTALYRAKELGKNRYELYNQSMNFKASEKLALENDLRRALERHELSLSYQPILDLKTNKITSIETLLRWQHGKYGQLLPGKFLDIAEEIGLIVPIGRWVFATAFGDLVDFVKQGLDVELSVNVSARQFGQESLVDEILLALEQAGADASRIELEITESVAMENLDRTKNKLAQLKAKGFEITIDDFGTGYSSLNYLKRFPINKLKIDKSFVRHMITDEQDTSIIKAIISMAKSLNLKVVAEGVDMDMQVGILKSLGCDAIQGFTISKALKKKELIEFIKYRNS